MEDSIHGGTPVAGWFIVENPMNKWMMTGGTAISGNIHISAFHLSLLWVDRTDKTLFSVSMSRMNCNVSTSVTG